MPLKDDLIQRTLEQLAEVVRELRGLHAEQAAKDAESFLKDAYQTHTGTEGELVRRLPSDQLLSILSSAGTVDREKAFLMAALLQAEAALAALRGESTTGLNLKAFDLYLEAALAELDLDDLDGYIAGLDLELADFVLPEATLWRRFEYAWLRGNYAEAEDRLFGLLEASPESDAKLRDRGRTFYLTLQNTPEAKLDAGGLPMAEVKEGAEAFELALSERRQA